MNYKDSLNLPQTGFPMKADLVRREPEMLARWEQQGLYHQIQEARQRQGATLFVLHDGPPFANGDVHMGTALNKILKDIVVKHKAMTGFRAPYVPGWDCHGLPIEFKVVKNHANLSPLQVRQKSEEFARKYIEIQRRQFKRLGVLGDWENPYLTLDRRYEADILRVFARLVAKGLVYRSKKPVYWSTGAQTALAEAEVEYADKESPAIYVKFEVVGMAPKTSVLIWTTTPWTLPANLAVAIHPKLSYGIYTLGGERVILCDSLPSATHERLQTQSIPGAVLKAEDLLKLKLRHPFLDREVPVLAADYVTSDTGTGCVHTAPGHGQDDYHTAKHLGLLSPVDDQGRFTAECGVPEWVGKYVFDANRDVIELLRARGMLVDEETIRHSYPHCWRSKTPVIFRAIEQWFIKVDAIKEDALRAIEKVKWVPAWGENRIRGTVASRSDWCISRQRTWGVPLPIFYRAEGEPIVDHDVILRLADLVERRGTNVWFEMNDADMARELGLPAGVTRRHDTLDVWMDSGASHEAVLKRRSELAFPADVYLEGSDQHRGWFQSSLLTSVAANDGQAPYKTVITNGFLVDLDGKKISKSATYEKPKDAESFVNKYGADVVRLWVSSENYQNDVPLSEEIFTRISDTYRSIRNSLRILLANLHDFDPTRDQVDFLKMEVAGKPLGEEDRKWLLIDLWMISRVNDLVCEVRSAYEAYEFHRVYHAVNSFCAVALSALYVDITKDRMYCDMPDSPRRRATQTVMWKTADALIRLLAPILSFTAEEAWQHLPQSKESGRDNVHLQERPKTPKDQEQKILEKSPLWWGVSIVDKYSKEINLVELSLVCRMEVSEALEKARAEQKFGKSIDRLIALTVDNPDTARKMNEHGKQLAEIFIVSGIVGEVQVGEKVKVSVLPPPDGWKKCARSWRWDGSVGSDPEHPDLSARDAAAVRAWLKRRG